MNKAFLLLERRKLSAYNDKLNFFWFIDPLFDSQRLFPVLKRLEKSLSYLKPTEKRQNHQTTATIDKQNSNLVIKKCYVCIIVLICLSLKII